MTEMETKLQAEVQARDKTIAELQTKLSGKSGANGGSQPVGEFAKLERELTDALIGGAKTLTELPKHLQDNRFLLYMVKSNQIEFGRPQHYFNAKADLMPGDGEVSWTNCSGRGSKSLPELLAEEKRLGEENKLERTATIPADFGGDEKGQDQKKVPVNIRLQVRLSARAA